MVDGNVSNSDNISNTFFNTVFFYINIGLYTLEMNYSENEFGS